jgi:hypothetical protein
MRNLILFGGLLLISGNNCLSKPDSFVLGGAPTITLEKNGKIEPHFRPPFRIKKGIRIA